MIYVRYQDFRPGFALVGAPIAADGFPEWPVAKLRSGGFDAGITVPSIESFPFNITVNGYAADATFGVDLFDFYVSQRTDDAPSQYLLIGPAQNDPSGLTFSPSNTYSGTISISLVSANVTKLLGSDTATYTEDENLAKLFKDVHVYVQRRSDKAIQWRGRT